MKKAMIVLLVAAPLLVTSIATAETLWTGKPLYVVHQFIDEYNQSWWINSEDEFGFSTACNEPGDRDEYLCYIEKGGLVKPGVEGISVHWHFENHTEYTTNFCKFKNESTGNWTKATGGDDGCRFSYENDQVYMIETSRIGQADDYCKANGMGFARLDFNRYEAGTWLNVLSTIRYAPCSD